MAPIDRAEPNVEDEVEIYDNGNEIRCKTQNKTVNEAHELKAEECAWYFLFPYGKNGLREQRDVLITPLDYFQYRILGSDTRFQRNDYLFYALSIFEYLRVKSTITECGQKIVGENAMVDVIHLYLKNLRKSAA
ncbi:ATP-dependent DNA helicase [Trichonephila inaurata madagascariensis]|uniref:ATP-dependent DNA helicase n=1 Tax=Trichonephila inaurata madagascariensis TaxID=2747483 RepID=A0A8X6X100_9ARAC|nr:ATP-dependent DNA helicase [Trichonephila inaurata madagascariensis]